MALNGDAGAHTDRIMYPVLGTADVEAGVYANASGLVLTSDYTPGKPIRSILVSNHTAADITGVIDVTLWQGGRMIIDVKAPANDCVEVLRGWLVKTIHSTATTDLKTNGAYIFPGS